MMEEEKSTSAENIEETAETAAPENAAEEPKKAKKAPNKKEALLKDICPIDDVRATKEYRQNVAFRMLVHNVKQLWKEETAC